MEPQRNGGESEPCLLEPGAGDGSLEHFWHLSLGLLFPVLDLLVDGQLAGKQPIAASCGPVMDTVLHEALSAVVPAFSIVDRGTFDGLRPTTPLLRLQRWDVNTRAPEHRKAVRAKALNIYSRLGTLLADGCTCEGHDFTRNSALLLERSQPHAFYGPQGPAEVKTYGRERRHIANLSECAAVLTGRGWDVRVFDAGQHSYACQVKAFMRCGAIVGIRGAEFANLFWCTPGTPVLMLSPSHAVTAIPQELPAWIKGLPLMLQPVEGNTPELDTDRTERFFELAGLSAGPRAGPA